MASRETKSIGGAAEPDLKRRRLLDAGGPVEDDERARQKMRDAEVYKSNSDDDFTGFDPDNIADMKHLSGSYEIKPMGYFAQRGDLKMMRWLYVNGADTRDEDVSVFHVYFPMMSAACFGRIDACKWLFARGASADIKRRTKSIFENNIIDGSCLSFALGNGKRELSRWLILNGALCKDNTSGELDREAMGKDLNGTFFSRSNSTFMAERSVLLEWANGLQYARDSFLRFLMGTLSPAEYSPSSLRKVLLKKLESEQATSRLLESLPTNQHRQLWDELLAARAKRQPNNLSLLSGKPGVLELVCDYVGIVRGREARIIRQLAEILPRFNEIMDSLDQSDSDEEYE